MTESVVTTPPSRSVARRLERTTESEEVVTTHEVTDRHKALTEAWQAVDRAITPLGHGGGATDSPWNKGYKHARDQALNAILALRDGSS